MRARCKLWTGPGELCRAYAEAISEVATFTIEGTEHVLWDMNYLGTCPPESAIHNTAAEMEREGIDKNFCNTVRMYGKVISTSQNENEHELELGKE